MGTLRDELAADLEDAVADYDQSFDWNGATFPCVRVTGAAGMLVVTGGMEVETSDRITVALADLPSGGLPSQGDLVDGYALQIMKVDPNVGHLVLWCAPAMNTGGED